MVYDVVYIPQRGKKFPTHLYVENDANCFALGEYWFWQRQRIPFIALTPLLRLGSGLYHQQKIIRRQKNGGAGEFGMIDHLIRPLSIMPAGNFEKKRRRLTAKKYLKMQ